MSRQPSIGPKGLLLAVALMVGSVGLAVLLSARGTVPSVPTLVALFAAFMLLDVFDLLLPRGDRIGLDGPIAAAAVFVTAPPIVLSLVLVARGFAMLVRRERALEDWAVELSTTASGISASLLVLAPLRTTAARSSAMALFSVALACVALLTAQVLVSQLYSSRRMGRPYGGLVVGNLRFQRPLLAAEVCASVLLALTYEQMGPWALVLVVVLLLLLRHSYGLLISVRQTYMNTVEVLVDTAELSDPRRAGHSERTAQLARSIAEEVGLDSRDIERLSYAALLHDLDMVGLDPGEVGTYQQPNTRQAGRVLSQVGFLADVVPVLRILDADPDTVDRSSSEQRTLSMIIALASDIDSRTMGIPLLGEGDVARVAGLLSASEKAKVIAATIRLGHSVPAVP